MIGAENVYSLIEASCNELVIVVSDIGHNISVKAVAPAENEVLVQTVIGSSEPYSAVLFVSLAGFEELVHDHLCFVLCVDRAFSEPVIVYDAVLFEVTLETCDIQRQSVVYKSLAAVLFGNVLKLEDVIVVVICSMFDYVCAEVNVLRHLEVLSLAALSENSGAEGICIVSVLIDELLSLVGAELHVAERQ